MSVWKPPNEDVWGSGDIVGSILNLCIRWSRSVRSTPGERSSATIYIAELMGPRTGLYNMKEKISFLLSGIEPWPHSRRVLSLLAMPTELFWLPNEFQDSENELITTGFHKTESFWLTQKYANFNEMMLLPATMCSYICFLLIILIFSVKLFIQKCLLDVFLFYFFKNKTTLFILLLASKV